MFPLDGFCTPALRRPTTPSSDIRRQCPGIRASESGAMMYGTPPLAFGTHV